jgi:vacuolar-type H+-ATPase subunit H
MHTRSTDVSPSRTHDGREVDSVGEDKQMEDIKFFQDVLSKEHKDQPNSPLYMIREKELEISGRVLAAKKKAEQIVSDARKKSSETFSQAESEGEKQARAVEERMMRDAEDEAARIMANVDVEVADVQARAVKQSAQAVKVVVEAVSKV